MSERPKRPSKDEMTISNNFTIAFEHVPTPLTITTGEYVIKGVAAALSINNDIHVVITAPNSKVLLEAWGKITNIKLDESKTLPVYQSLIGKGDLTQIKSPELSTSKQQCNPWYWYYNPKHKECFIEGLCGSVTSATQFGKLGEETETKRDSN